jgi:RHS repeat-associated protein
LNITGYSQVLKQTETDLETGEQANLTYIIGRNRICQITVKNGTEQEYYFTFDGHGSTRVLTDFAGAILELYAFDAYGNAIGFDPSVALTEFLYSGEQFDSKIGQQYLRARYYDPTTGRFNRLDPFFGDTNDPLSLHKYLYTHDDPINSVDPSGNMSVGMAISIGIGISLGSMGVGATLGAIYGKDSVVGAFGLGILQGWANIFNSIQDIAIGLLDLFIFSQNMQWRVMSGGLIPFQMPMVTSPDWSRGLFTEEDKEFLGLGEYWGDSHGWSKFIGGESLVALVSMGTTSALNPSARVLMSSDSMLKPRAGYIGIAKKLTQRQQTYLSKLNVYGDELVVRKNQVSMADLRNMTMNTGVEFAILSNGSRRVIIRGQAHSVPIPKKYVDKGWKYSGHTHTSGSITGSPEDRLILKEMGQQQSSVTGMLWGDKGHKYDVRGIVIHDP